MTFHPDKPELTDDAAVALTSYVEQSLEHLKDSINQEHGWNDSSAASCVHDTTLLKKFVGVGMRSITAATETVDYTGIGFTPQLIIFGAFCATATSELSFSIGAYDGTNNHCIYGYDTGSFGTHTFNSSATKSIYMMEVAGSKYQTGAVSAVDSGQFSIDWTESGTDPGAGNIYFIYICIGFQS